jgi:PhoH-like ATPase
MKNFVLDATVLLHDAQALFVFEDNNVIIPMSVIESIDRFKKEVTEIGRNARQASRLLDGLRKDASLISGVKLENGGTLYVRTDASQGLRSMAGMFHDRTPDVYVLAVAISVKLEGDIPTVLVTKDINLRIKADALGLVVQDYESDKVDIEELYPGTREVAVGGEIVESFNKNGAVSLEGEFFPNQYVELQHRDNKSMVSLGRYDAARNKVVRLLQPDKDGQWRISARNREQAFAMDALVNDDIGLVSLLGKAGTGKTLLAVAAAIYKTVDENEFSRILVSRPTLPLGKDIGYLPGTVEEKLTPWMYPIADNVELIMRSEGKARRQVRGFRELIDMGILVIEPLTYIRGRSIHNQYLIVDEAQNLTPHEIKTIITRVGEGTKIVLTGDPYQIDNIYVDSSSNGLTYAVERFKRESIAAHVTLTKGERSKISELAANLL